MKSTCLPLEREREFCLLCCLADSYYGQSLAIIVWLLYYNNVYWFSCYYCLMSDKKQLKGRGFISVEVSGDIVHYGQKAWKQNQLRLVTGDFLVKSWRIRKQTKEIPGLSSPPPTFIQCWPYSGSGSPPQLIFLKKKKFLKTYPKVCLTNDLSISEPNKVNNWS